MDPLYLKMCWLGLLRAANLPICDKQLVRATITELKYDAVKTKVDIFEQYRSTNQWIQYNEY